MERQPTNISELYSQTMQKLLEAGFDVDTITVVNQGTTISGEREGDIRFSKLLKEKEDEGYRKEGEPFFLPEGQKIQIIVREKK